MGRGFGWIASSLYPPAAGGGQVFERRFVQSQLLGLLALFCFLDVSHRLLLFCWPPHLIREMHALRS